MCADTEETNLLQFKGLQIPFLEVPIVRAPVRDSGRKESEQRHEPQIASAKVELGWRDCRLQNSVRGSNRTALSDAAGCFCPGASYGRSGFAASTRSVLLTFRTFALVGSGGSALGRGSRETPLLAAFVLCQCLVSVRSPASSLPAVNPPPVRAPGFRSRSPLRQRRSPVVGTRR